jgi:hypothetical protein
MPNSVDSGVAGKAICMNAWAIPSQFHSFTEIGGVGGTRKAGNRE